MRYATANQTVAGAGVNLQLKCCHLYLLANQTVQSKRVCVRVCVSMAAICVHGSDRMLRR